MSWEGVKEDLLKAAESYKKTTGMKVNSLSRPCVKHQTDTLPYKEELDALIKEKGWVETCPTCEFNRQ